MYKRQKLTRSRGQELAQQVREGKAPAWVQNLGPVPTRKRAARRWARVAGEIDAMRTKYGVPESHPEPLPRELIREAGQRVNNARLAAEGAPVSAGSKVRTRAAEAVLGVWEQVKSMAKAARLSKRASESQSQGQSPKPESGTEPRQQQAPAPQQNPTGEAAQPETRKEKPVSETEERLRQERAARAERARQMMERTRSLDERLRNEPAPQANQQQSAQQNLQRQRQQQAQQMHEQARRGVRGPGL